MNIAEICERYGAEYLPQTPVAPYTSFKIGGKCDIVKVNGIGLLRAVLRHCRENGLPRYIIGKGSNLLISDKGLDGPVLIMGSGFNKIDVDGEVLKCQAGAKLSDVCKVAALHSLGGLEFAYGIPGTVGGALYMNAGAYGGEIADVAESCSWLDEDGALPEPAIMTAAEMRLGYRTSVFSESGGKVITKVRLRLKYSDRTRIKAKMDEFAAARVAKQPLDYPSAGSAFKRPPGHFAAKLIDDCGLRGRTVGGAKVSEKHAGFIVNTGGATFADVTALLAIVREEVFAKTGVTLETEIRILEPRV